MSDVLVRIKRLVLKGHYEFSKKAKEYLYVIQSTNLDGLFIYSRGKFMQEAGVET